MKIKFLGCSLDPKYMYRAIRENQYLLLHFYVFVEVKALCYNFSFGNSLLKWLQNLAKNVKSSLMKVITSFTSFCKFLVNFFQQVYWF